jgi:hypothetical protein
MAETRHPSNVINIDLALLVASITFGSILVELEADALVSLIAIRIRLIDLRVLGQFAVGLEGARLVGRILENDVALLVLVVAEGEEDDVALVDPNFLSKLATFLRKQSVLSSRSLIRWISWGFAYRICAKRRVPSKHCASKRPFPSILMTWAYSECFVSGEATRRWGRNRTYLDLLL